MWDGAYISPRLRCVWVLGGVLWNFGSWPTVPSMWHLISPVVVGVPSPFELPQVGPDASTYLAYSSKVRCLKESSSAADHTDFRPLGPSSGSTRRSYSPGVGDLNKHLSELRGIGNQRFISLCRTRPGRGVRSQWQGPVGARTVDRGHPGKSRAHHHSVNRTPCLLVLWCVV